MADNTKPNTHFSPLAYTAPVYERKVTRPLNVDDLRKLEHPVAKYLFEVCTYARPANTKTERKYVALLIEKCISLAGADRMQIDEAGNVIVDLRKGPQHRTMFTSHTDTVHSVYGTQQIEVFEENGDVFFHAPAPTLDDQGKRRYKFGEVLGADDGAGIAVMLHMLAKKVPGLYVFFREEECGGTGSRYMAKDPALLAQIDRCISIDRAGYHDVITHQGGSRCCSDEFAYALGDALTADDLTLIFSPDSGGVFTDSANLTEIVAECTNLSCGYFRQHTEDEHQNVTWLCKFADRMVQVDWDSLPVKRDPHVIETGWGNYRGDTARITLGTGFTTGQKKRGKKTKQRERQPVSLIDLEDAIICAQGKDDTYLRGILREYNMHEALQELLYDNVIPEWALGVFLDDVQYGYHTTVSQALSDFLDLLRHAKKEEENDSFNH